MLIISIAFLVSAALLRFAFWYRKHIINYVKKEQKAGEVPAGTGPTGKTETRMHNPLATIDDWFPDHGLDDIRIKN